MPVPSCGVLATPNISSGCIFVHGNKTIGAIISAVRMGKGRRNGVGVVNSCVGKEDISKGLRVGEPIRNPHTSDISLKRLRA